MATVARSAIASCLLSGLLQFQKHNGERHEGSTQGLTEVWLAAAMPAARAGRGMRTAPSNWRTSSWLRPSGSASTHRNTAWGPATVRLIISTTAQSHPVHLAWKHGHAALMVALRAERATPRTTVMGEATA